jgi:hypothetical protein
VAFSILVVVVLLCVSCAFTSRCSQQHASSRRVRASRCCELSLTVVLTSAFRSKCAQRSAFLLPALHVSLTCMTSFSHLQYTIPTYITFSSLLHPCSADQTKFSLHHLQTVAQHATTKPIWWRLCRLQSVKRRQSDANDLRRRSRHHLRYYRCPDDASRGSISDRHAH